jgi:UDP-glucose 4-epimerase|tara:strand:- start:111 stop:968 length:858 start_codon:yes stop_codon:yes gene_type:complete
MQKALVTGGAGFIGTNLIKRLLKDGYEVVSIDNYSTGLKENEQKNCTYVELDITEIHKKHKSYWSKFDVVYHLAAIARIQPSFNQPVSYFETNALATMKIAEMCAQSSIPLIYAGSSSHHAGQYSNPYTFSKSTGEEILHMFEVNYGLKFAIARFYNVYGPYQLTEGGYTTLIGRWINNIEKGLPCEIYGDGEQRRDFTHVDDIVDGLIRMHSDKAYRKTYELGRGCNHSVNEVAEMFGINPEYKLPKPGEARDTLCESEDAKIDLGWYPKLNLSDYIMSWKNNQ